MKPDFSWPVISVTSTLISDLINRKSPSSLINGYFNFVLQPEGMTLFERHRRTYLGYTIGQSLFSNRWIIRRGWTHVGCAPSAFDAVDLVDQFVDTQAIGALLRHRKPLVADSPSREQERCEAINGKNPSPAILVENLARASLPVERDLAELRVGRSSDNRAPRLRDEIGLDQGNQAEAAVDANPSSSPDIDAFLNHPSIAALRQEERALSLKLAEEVADDPKSFRSAVGATSEIEAPESGSESLPANERDRPSWNALKGVPNTDEILNRKGEIICKLIGSSLKNGEFAASTVNKSNSLIASTPQQGHFNDKAEIAAFLIYIIDRFVIKFMTFSRRFPLSLLSSN